MKTQFSLAILLAFSPPLAAQVVFTDTFATDETGINSDLPARQTGGAVTNLQWIRIPQTDTNPSAGIDQDKALFNHSYTGSGVSGLDTHSVWTPSANGITPYDFASQIGGRKWTLSFAASVNNATATDRFRFIVQDSSTPSIGDTSTADVAWQLSASGGTTSGAGVKLLLNGTKINWPDATNTTSSGQTQRLYSFTVDEPNSYSLTSAVNSQPFASGIGNLTGLTGALRHLFVHVWDRQVGTAAAPNLTGSLDSITLSVVPLGPTISSFTAAPATIAPGGSVLLAWSVTGAQSLSISPAIGTVTGNSISVSPTQTTTYTLTATNSSGSTTAQRSVTVQAPIPVISSFIATPPTVITGSSSTLSWSVTDATSVNISPGIGTVAASGSTLVTPAATTTYTLTATNAFGPALSSTTVNVVSEKQPNFLFIAIDDLRPVVGFMSENPGNFLNRIYPDPAKRAAIRQILTPNIDRLAASGIGFHRAFCPVAVCNPSRTAIMTGYRSKQSGIVGNADGHFRADTKPTILRTVTTLPRHLRNNGYFATGAGKIYHGSNDLEADFTGVTINGTFYNSWDTWFSSVPSTGSSGSRVKSLYSPSGEMDFGYDSGPLEGQNDYATADFIGRLLKEGTVTHEGRTATLSNNQPFFLACGIFRPHLPFYMPKSLLDLFDVNDIAVDQATLDFFTADLNDITGGGSTTSGDFADILANNPPTKLGGIPAWRETIRHYIAATALADRCVGNLLDALEASPHAANTIVVLWSDHGWYLGEKLRFRKTQLWDEAANCVLIVRDPRPGKQAAPGTPCYRPVSLQDLYPTISSLAGIPKPSHVAGYDISPLFTHPDRTWNIPALTTIGTATEDAIRMGRWAYLRRNTSELYDVANDPDEITNLFNNPAYLDVRNMLLPLLNRVIAGDSFPERDQASYESWRLGSSAWFAAEATPLDPNANPDGDAANNLMEYYLAKDPAKPDFFGSLPSFLGNGKFGIRFRMRDGDPTLHYRVMHSTDLGLSDAWRSIWSSRNAGDLNAATLSMPAPGIRDVEVSTPSGAPRGFLRMEVRPD